MSTLCGADCGSCYRKDSCKGCPGTCESPFGGRCIAASYIKTGGIAAYREFREKLRGEINELFASLDLPGTDELFELAGEYVNLEYPLPGGGKAKFLDDRNIYLGCQVEIPDVEMCCGAVADASFILICRYGENGSDPELLLYRRR